ncbi:MAG: 30S ribosomal protein S9, partial [Pseudomonadota bacterium]
MSEVLNSLEDLGAATGAADAGEATEAQAPVYVQKLDPHGRAYATGKRKDAVARVWVKPGAGKIVVNGKDMTAYFARPVLQLIINQPLELVDRKTQYDIMATVS